MTYEFLHFFGGVFKYCEKKSVKSFEYEFHVMKSMPIANIYIQLSVCRFECIDLKTQSSISVSHIIVYCIAFCVLKKYASIACVCFPFEDFLRR